MSDMTRLSAMLLELHQGSNRIDAGQFQSWALQRLKQVIPFDSAVWVSAAVTPQGAAMHGTHLEGQPPKMMLDYEQYKKYDNFFTEAVRQPGVPIRSRASQGPRDMWPYLERYGLVEGMATLAFDTTTALVTVISLYRSQAAHPYSAADASFMEAVFAHLVEADRRCKLIGLQQAAEASTRAHGQGGFASCDNRGLLRYSDQVFQSALLAEWPDWRGPWLPPALLPMASAPCDGLAVGRNSIVRSTALGELCLLHLRKRRLLDGLPSRLRQVAELAIKGQSHKEIAAQLGIAPATVRNHLTTLFNRLHVSNKTELAARLRDSGFAQL